MMNSLATNTLPLYALNVWPGF